MALFNCVFFSYDITLFFNVGFFVVVGFLSTSLLRSSKISTNFAGNQPTKSEQRDKPDKDTEKSLHKAQWELRINHSS